VGTLPFEIAMHDRPTLDPDSNLDADSEPNISTAESKPAEEFPMLTGNRSGPSAVNSNQAQERRLVTQNGCLQK